MAARAGMEFLRLAEVVPPVAVQQVQPVAVLELPLYNELGYLGDGPDENRHRGQMAAPTGEMEVPWSHLPQVTLVSRQPDLSMVRRLKEPPVLPDRLHRDPFPVDRFVMHRLAVLILKLGASRPALQVVADCTAAVGGEPHVLTGPLHLRLDVLGGEWPFSQAI